VEWLHAHVGALERPLEQTPEVLQPIGVNLVVHVGDGVVNHFMLKLIEALIGLQRIGEDRGASEE
jgi:hypothetical protein